MNFRPGTRDEPEINLIPFIDILLVVLIFLMLTTTYSKFTQLQVNLPVADAQAQRDNPKEIIVSISADGRYAVDKDLVEGATVEVLTRGADPVGTGQQGNHHHHQCRRGCHPPVGDQCDGRCPPCRPGADHLCHPAIGWQVRAQQALTTPLAALPMSQDKGQARWQAVWRERGWQARLLWPVSWLYGIDESHPAQHCTPRGLLTIHRLPVPVLVVGNVVVGGAGKTPTVLALLCPSESPGLAARRGVSGPWARGQRGARSAGRNTGSGQR